MVDEVDQLSFDKGLSIIRREIDMRLAQHNVEGAQVAWSIRGGPVGTADFTVSARSKTAKAEFSANEIQDSATAIDHPAATKVLHLVSHFVA